MTNAHAIAVEGIGFGRLQVATLGYLPTLFDFDDWRLRYNNRDRSASGSAYPALPVHVLSGLTEGGSTLTGTLNVAKLLQGLSAGFSYDELGEELGLATVHYEILPEPNFDEHVKALSGVSLGTSSTEALISLLISLAGASEGHSAIELGPTQPRFQRNDEVVSIPGNFKALSGVSEGSSTLEGTLSRVAALSGVSGSDASDYLGPSVGRFVRR